MGFAPVPLFNSVPHGNALTSVAIGMDDVMDALVRGASPLDSPRPTSAPPAFLLDSRRRGAGVSLVPGMFDNRSISLPTDFPSANFLLSQGLRRVVLIQQGAGSPQTDLCHTLRRWQQAGIEILSASADDPTGPVPVTIGRPKWFRHIWYGLLAGWGLHRNPLGGYGGFIPLPSAG
jgi:hypothetical protein